MARPWRHITAARTLILAALFVLTPSAGQSQTAAPLDSDLRGHGGPVRAMAVLSDGATLVTGGFDSTLIVWDLASGRAKRVLRFHGSTVNAISALPGGCFASGGEDGRIALWCGEGASPQRVLEGHTAPVTHLAVSGDGTQLASASFDRTVRLWPLQAGGVDQALATQTFEGFSAPVNAVAFWPANQGLLAGGYDGGLRVIPLDASGVALRANLGVPINAIAIDAAGLPLIAGADGHIRVLGPDLAITADIDVGTGPLTALALSPDGSRIATAGMRTQVTLIDRATRTVAFEILGPGLPVWSLAYGPGGAELFTGGQDRAVRRWDGATAKPSGRDVATAGAPETLPLASERGAQVFRACQACHGVTPGDTNRAGPTLAGLFGRRIASQPGYAYSDGLKKLELVWTPETFTQLFTLGPALYTPGTKMPEQTLTDAGDRDALIAWLARVTAP
jgi:cytochrome c